MNEMKIPTKDSLSYDYDRLSQCKCCIIRLVDRFIVGDNAELYSNGSITGKCRLVYEMDVLQNNEDLKLSVLNRNASILWYDCTHESISVNNVAYIYLLDIKPDYRRKGIGSAFVSIQHELLNFHEIERIDLEATYQGVIFWYKMGYTFVRENDFWNEFEEFCIYGEDTEKYKGISKLEDIPQEYLDYLHESKLKYKMYKLL